MINDTTKKALQWALGRDTGISSKTIAAALSDTVQEDAYYGLPSDSSDFGRCHRLLELIPEWKPRLPEVAEKFPEWELIVRHWDTLSAFYEAGDQARVYGLIEELRVMRERQ